MRRRSNGSSGGVIGVTFIDLLQIAFIVLKLCGVINWNWAIVLLPTWGSFLIVMVILYIITHVN